jgi:hypothetical protein
VIQWKPFFYNFTALPGNRNERKVASSELSAGKREAAMPAAVKTTPVHRMNQASSTKSARHEIVVVCRGVEILHL